MRWTGCPGIMSDMARRAIGALKTTPTQNRRVMSTSSGIGFFLQGYGARFQRHPADRAGAGLGAHDFRMHGADVLGLDGGADGAAGSSAIPHLGHGPGFRRTDIGIHRTDVGSLLGFIWLRSMRSRVHAWPCAWPWRGIFRNLSGSSLNFARQ